MWLLYRSETWFLCFLAGKSKQRGKGKETKDGARQHPSERDAVAVDWTCVVNREGRDPTHCPHLGTRGQKKEGETERKMKARGGERTARAGFKILG